jgi:hypothetical protein
MAKRKDCQLDLFEKKDKALARRTDPDTSHEAAHKITAERLNASETVVLAALRGNPNGLTNHELVSETGMTWNTATPRIHPLVQKGKVYDSGQRRVGPAGRNCIVWKAI